MKWWHIRGGRVAAARITRHNPVMAIALSIVFALALAAALAAGWLLVHLRRQSAGIAERLARLEHPEPPDPRLRWPGFPAQTVLNDFALPLLSGDMSRLSRFRGQEIALIFVQPSCPHSHALAARLAAARKPAADRPTAVFVSTGDVAANQRLAADAGSSPVFLQEDIEVATLMRVHSTPGAYLVDREGVTRGPLISGAANIAVAAGLPAGNAAALGNQTTLLPPAPAPGVTPLLPGAAAPRFELATLTGDRIIIGEPRPRPLVLLLADVDCPPCRSLLAGIARRRPAGDGLVVALHGDAEETGRVADALALRDRVATIATRDLPRRLGVLETPAAFLIDASGRIAAAPAIGSAAIERLMGQP